MWKCPSRLYQAAAPSWALTAGAWEKQMCAHGTSGRARAHMEPRMLTATLVTKVTNCSCSLLGGKCPPETSPEILDRSKETLAFRYLSPQDTVDPLPESLCPHEPAFTQRTLPIIILEPWGLDQQGCIKTFCRCWLCQVSHTKHKHRLQKWLSQ